MCSCFGTWLAACVLCSIAQCSLAVMYVNEAPIAQLPAVYIILMSLALPTFTILLCRVQSTLPPAVGARSLKFKLVASVVFIVSAVVTVRRWRCQLCHHSEDGCHIHERQLDCHPRKLREGNAAAVGLRTDTHGARGG